MGMDIELNPIHKKIVETYFSFDHLPEHLAAISEPFHALATKLAQDSVINNYDGAETTVALRKLLEAKDAAVRAALPIKD